LGRCASFPLFFAAAGGPAKERFFEMPEYRVLLVDIPSYAVPVPSPYRELLERRLRAETVLREQRWGFSASRPGLTYSRGLLLVAAYLERYGHHVDYLVAPDPKDIQCFARLSQHADVIGITATTPVVQQAYALFQQARALNPGVFCVLGGPHASATGERCLAECPDLDVVIPGSGEIVFVDLLAHLNSYQDIAGIIYRLANQGFIHNRQPASIKPIPVTEMPMPAYHLLSRPLKDYAHNIRTFNGCPYQCTFCMERVSWQGKRGMNDLENVINEIRLVTQGARPKTLFHFSDSVFTLNKARTLELCARLAREPLDVVFSCDTRVDQIDAEIIQAMVAARFGIIRLGIETLDDDLLQSAHKDILATQSLQTVGLLRRLAPSMAIHAYILTGLPGSNLDTLANSARNIQFLIEKNHVDVIGNKILVPYPGTPYFENPRAYQMGILHHTWSKYDRLSFPVYRTATLTEHQLWESFLWLEETQLRAYEARIKNCQAIDAAPPESLDYVYRSYVEQVGLGREI
jgi:anaerobic magnesium-protoporphyrin IX monomethyl ester cyclase